MQRLRAPATEWPPMLAVGSAGDAGAHHRRRARPGRGAGGAGRRLELRARARRAHQPRQPGDRQPRVRDHPGGGRPAGAGVLARAARPRAWSVAASTSPATATRAPTPTTSCRSSRTTSIACAPWSWRRSRRRPRAGVEAFMTAHVLYPALDPDRPATLSRRIATELLRGELGFRGVLVSDDLGMKAVADRYPIEELAVGAIEAGCRSPAGARAGRAPARGVRGDRPRRRGAQRHARPRRGERRARARAQGRLHRGRSRARRDVAVAARHARPQGTGRIIRGRRRGVGGREVTRRGLAIQPLR